VYGGTERVTVQTGPGHLRAVLTRPGGGNALSPDVVSALHSALDEAEHTEQCRAFVVAARGESFCTGLDLADAGLVKGWENGEAHRYRDLTSRLRASPLVTIALVDGAAAGGGVGLAAACDLVLVSSRARFRLTEVFFGLLPAMILPCIARRVGEPRAFRMALLAEDVGAQEAVGIGLADDLAEQLEPRLRRTLAALGRTDALTVAELKTSRNLLFPEDSRYAVHAQRLLGRRLSDPFVQERLGRLREEGMLR
jgi:polyketide biosynthesis enoyl-CoA hydratase PksH